ncbi:MAG: DUF924 domain-containing protein [Myxococcales bacterium]|nr:DUF924 domain-containing protein [Myxococcales bacterium]
MPDLAQPETTPQAVLDFWFEGVTPTDHAAAFPRWFSKDPANDQAIRERFGAAVDAALAGQLDGWAAEPRGALALVILLDQFTRNLFRGKARAFAGDPKARAIASTLVAQGADRALSPIERVFLYLPFEHGEAPADQARSIACYEQLRADGGDRFQGFLDYAYKHKAVIDEFGRYPHRNVALGRDSTPEEQAWLDAGGGF